MNTTEQIKNNNQPLISIIIPVYKVEPYLRDCIDSCIQQTYKNIEIILVDDGSPDQCPDICDEYAKKDSRIRVLHKKNGGLSDARNEGMKIAKGEWWTFVDSDDVIHPEMVEKLKEAILTNDNILVSCCSYKRIDEDYCLENNQFDISDYNHEVLLFNDYIKKTFWVTAWGKLYHYSLFSTIKYPINRLHEDLFITYKILYETKRISYLNYQLYFYRKRKTSITGNKQYKNIIDKYDALTENFYFFKEKQDIILMKYSIKKFFLFYLSLYTDEFKHLQTKKYKKQIKEFINSQKYGIFNKNESIKLSLKLHFPRSYRLFRDCKKKIKKRRNDRIDYKLNLQK